MGKTLSEIRTLTREFIDDRSGDRWTDAELLPIINEAQSIIEDIVDEANERYFEKGQEYSVVAATDSYEFNLPDDFKKAVLAERAVSGGRPIRCEWVDFTQRHNHEASYHPILLNTPNPPKVYIRADKFGVVKPTESYTICFWYNYKLPDFVNDTDETDIPSQYVNLLAIQAAMLTKGEDDTDLPAPIQRTFQAGIERLRLNVQSRQEQEPRTVNYIEDY